MNEELKNQVLSIGVSQCARELGIHRVSLSRVVNGGRPLSPVLLGELSSLVERTPSPIDFSQAVAVEECRMILAERLPKLLTQALDVVEQHLNHNGGDYRVRAAEQVIRICTKK